MNGEKMNFGALYLDITESQIFKSIINFIILPLLYASFISQYGALSFLKLMIAWFGLNVGIRSIIRVCST